MKLQIKFTLLFIFVFGAGLALTSVFSYRFLQENARQEVLQQARLMLQSAISMRHYTETEIAPLLDTPATRKVRFLPQSIPFYAATQGFNLIRRQYPDYAYKEAALNPTNPRDKAADWEADVINTFRNHGDRHELIGERDTPTGPSLFLARPVAAQTACLECHSRASIAPASMTRIYGPSNGFGWKDGEVVGAQIISIPASIAEAVAQSAFRNLIVYLAVVALVTLVVLNITLYVIVIRPVTKLSALAESISRGNLDAEIPVQGSDEIAVLGRSFNRVYVSLSKAMQMLDGH